MKFVEKSSIVDSILWTTYSVIFFQILRLILNQKLIPQNVRSQGKVSIWKWVNTSDSLLHSFITGVGSLICIYIYPDTITDIVTTYSTLAHALTAFSIGYFIFDFSDMFLNHRKRSSYELMIHHTFVICCFGTSLMTTHYLGYVMVALVIEVNSVFLHWRQLLILSNVSKISSYYRTISVLNILTFVIFRIITLGWMTRWLALNKDKVSTPIHTLGCVTMVTIICMSLVLLYRIFRADLPSLISNNTMGHKSPQSMKKCQYTTEEINRNLRKEINGAKKIV